MRQCMPIAGLQERGSLVLCCAVLFCAALRCAVRCDDLTLCPHFKCLFVPWRIEPCSACCRRTQQACPWHKVKCDHCGWCGTSCSLEDMLSVLQAGSASLSPSDCCIGVAALHLDALWCMLAGVVVDEVEVLPSNPPQRPTSVPQALQQNMPLASVSCLTSKLKDHTICPGILTKQSLSCTQACQSTLLQSLALIA